MKAIVTNNQDPEAKGRVKVKIPEFMGDQELPFWAEPRAGTPGVDWCPQVGDVVEVEPTVSANGMFTSPPVYYGFYGRMKDGKFKPTNTSVNPLQTMRQVTTEGWVVQVIEGDDGKVVVSRRDGNQTKAPTITIKAGGSITIETNNSDLLIQGGDGTVTVNANKVQLRGDPVVLGNGGSHLTLFETLKTAFESHTHSNGNNGSPTGPPLQPLPDTAKSKHEADT